MNVSVAELTPRGSGAVSVLRVRGPDAASVVRDLCGGVEPARGAPRCVRLMLGGEDLDEALACALPSGEFELHVHGSPTLVRRLTGSLGTESVLRLGARPGAPACARPGAPACPRAEPQSIEERAALALASAPCEGAARILLDQAEGALTRELRSISAEPLERRDRAIDTLLSRWSVARMALEPAEVVIAGPVNAGKSTLFNALLGERRAIVGPETGTTRDRLRARALLGQWPAWISDTAGGLDPSALASASPVDREGQERARRARGSADLVLWLDPLDPSRPPAKPPSREPPPHEWGRRAILVHTFADLVERTSRTSGALSALRDPAGARERVAEIFRAAFSLPTDPWIRGAAVPFSADQARAISSLRERDGVEFEHALEALLGDGGDPSAPTSVASETRFP